MKVLIMDPEKAKQLLMVKSVPAESSTQPDGDRCAAKKKP
jgi:hypothetical protein